MCCRYGVVQKDEGDGHLTLIFWARYVDWLLTTPVTAALSPNIFLLRPILIYLRRCH